MKRKSNALKLEVAIVCKKIQIDNIMTMDHPIYVPSDPQDTATSVDFAKIHRFYCFCNPFLMENDQNPWFHKNCSFFGQRLQFLLM